MGTDIMMLVTIPTGDVERLAALARERPRAMNPSGHHSSDGAAELFLNEMGAMVGEGPYGTSGRDMTTWVAPQNRVWPATFVDVLRPFWLSLFKPGRGEEPGRHPPPSIGAPAGLPPIMHDPSSVVVMWHAEQGLADRAIEISYNREKDDLHIGEHELPFCWTYP